ncbi:hypothetical protein GCM10010495_53090 [Kitasatospora herbaricolor]|uniref:SMI1/KNR4 family protein n=1 Tax=Kitasatospora herbaricolor TaxID=68217 RepID=UPI0019B8BEBE|nr:SMI1/KNR4 family protein [Kitasatospora herbaricolor]MDQ0312527.1 hypothetical protein [Kitasatospora herbaricolor]GGV30097.1 hypothetical protein GCM10010495_53090 [Kitasatospora herbaricolor]
MTTLTVEESWTRIETWLARHTAVSRRLLRPAALPADIAAAELRLGVKFPPDLKDSLLRHDGVQLQDGTPTLGYYGPLSGVDDIVRSTEFLRNVGAGLAENEDAGEGEGEDAGEGGADLDEEERGQYANGPHERLLITLGIGWQSSDGLFLVTRPGPHQGRVGRYFDEDIPSFTPWPADRAGRAARVRARGSAVAADRRRALARLDGALRPAAGRPGDGPRHQVGSGGRPRRAAGERTAAAGPGRRAADADPGPLGA